MVRVVAISIVHIFIFWTIKSSVRNRGIYMCYVVYKGNDISWFAKSEGEADEWIMKQNNPEMYSRCKRVYPTFMKAMECFKSRR